MKKTLKLIPAIAMLLISAVLVSTSTYAWFSMNQVVTATGMQVKASASSSLVISNEYPVGTSSTHAFSTAATELKPCDYDTTNTKYVYVSNPDVVDAGTGFASSGKTLTYADVTESNKASYYLDYVVYIASAGDKMTGQDLVVTLSKFTSGSTTLERSSPSFDTTFGTIADTLKATTIDFYLSTDNTTLGGRVGEIAVANMKTASVTVVSSGNIPKNGSSGEYCKVTMRIYFDGALAKEAGQAYVYSNTISTAGVTLDVAFTASTHTT